MDIPNRYLPRLPIPRLAASTGLVLTALLTSLPAAAQGTPQQRAACEAEGRWLCSNYIPDADQITACMVRNLRLLSPRCRAIFRGGSRRGTRKRPR